MGNWFDRFNDRLMEKKPAQIVALILTSLVGCGMIFGLVAAMRSQLWGYAILFAALSLSAIRITLLFWGDLLKKP